MVPIWIPSSTLEVERNSITPQSLYASWAGFVEASVLQMSLSKLYSNLGSTGRGGPRVLGPSPLQRTPATSSLLDDLLLCSIATGVRGAPSIFLFWCLPSSRCLLYHRIIVSQTLQVAVIEQYKDYCWRGGSRDFYSLQAVVFFSSCAVLVQSSITSQPTALYVPN
jgi:hypothetical protein